jgi:hypothetical protein
MEVLDDLEDELVGEQLLLELEIDAGELLTLDPPGVVGVAFELLLQLPDLFQWRQGATDILHALLTNHLQLVRIELLPAQGDVVVVEQWAQEVDNQALQLIPIEPHKELVLNREQLVVVLRPALRLQTNPVQLSDVEREGVLIVGIEKALVLKEFVLFLDQLLALVELVL